MKQVNRACVCVCVLAARSGQTLYYRILSAVKRLLYSQVRSQARTMPRSRTWLYQHVQLTAKSKNLSVFMFTLLITPSLFPQLSYPAFLDFLPFLSYFLSLFYPIFYTGILTNVYAFPLDLSVYIVIMTVYIRCSWPHTSILLFREEVPYENME